MVAPRLMLPVKSAMTGPQLAGWASASESPWPRAVDVPHAPPAAARSAHTPASEVIRPSVIRMSLVLAPGFATSVGLKRRARGTFL
jgi:hypothetical protein